MSDAGPRIPGAPPPGTPRVGRPRNPAEDQVVGPAGRTVDGPMGPRTITPKHLGAVKELAGALREGAQMSQSGGEGTSGSSESGVETFEEEAGTNDYAELIERIKADGDPAGDTEISLTNRFFDSKERRKKIESRLDPVYPSFDDYAMKGEFRQVVPIWGEGRPVVEFRSLKGVDQFAIRKLMSDVTAPLVMESLQTFLLVAAGTVRIGENLAPEFPPKGEEKFDFEASARREALRKRLHWILEQPFELIYDLYVNHLWFQVRCRRALMGKDATF